MQASEFKVVQAAFKALQFDDHAVESIWKLIAVILHLGNIEFDQHESNGESIATLSNQGSDVKTIADLIQVNPDEVKQALLTRVIAAHGEVNQYTDILYRDSSPNTVSPSAEFTPTRFWFRYQKIHLTRIFSAPLLNNSVSNLS